MALIRTGDHELRLLGMGSNFIAIDEARVNFDDLCGLESAQPGGIVRCRDNPRDCITIVLQDDCPIGCVAGWMSEV